LPASGQHHSRLTLETLLVLVLVLASRLVDDQQQPPDGAAEEAPSTVARSLPLAWLSADWPAINCAPLFVVVAWKFGCGNKTLARPSFWWK